MLKIPHKNVFYFVFNFRFSPSRNEDFPLALALASFSVAHLKNTNENVIRIGHFCTFTANIIVKRNCIALHSIKQDEKEEEKRSLFFSEYEILNNSHLVGAVRARDRQANQLNVT